MNSLPRSARNGFMLQAHICCHVRRSIVARRPPGRPRFAQLRGMLRDSIKFDTGDTYACHIPLLSSVVITTLSIPV